MTTKKTPTPEESGPTVRRRVTALAEHMYRRMAADVERIACETEASDGERVLAAIAAASAVAAALSAFAFQTDTARPGRDTGSLAARVSTSVMETARRLRDDVLKDEGKSAPPWRMAPHPEEP